MKARLGKPIKANLKGNRDELRSEKPSLCGACFINVYGTFYQDRDSSKYCKCGISQRDSTAICMQKWWLLGVSIRYLLELQESVQSAQYCEASTSSTSHVDG